MPVYSNRYYPPEQQVTWQDLGSGGTYIDDDYVEQSYAAASWVDGVANWNSWFDDNTQWVYTTTTNIDLGMVRTGYPITTTEWEKGNSTQFKSLTVSYQVSTDGITYSNVAAGILTGRYIKTQITSNSSYLSRIDTSIYFDTQQEVFTNVNTSVLSGTVNGRTLNLATVGNIAHISSQNTTGTYSPSSYDIDVISANTSSFTFVVKDLDTWGKANVDVSGLDIVVQGFPRIAANTRLGIVSKI